MRKTLPILGLLAVLTASPACHAQTPVGVLFPTGPTAVGIFVPSASVISGQSYTFVARVLMSNGLLNMPLPATSCAWSSSNPGVATINQLGTALGISQGSTTITCTDGAFVGSGTLTVAPPPLITNPACGLPPCALPAGTNGLAYSFTFTAVGGNLPYTWSILGSLPGWASLNSSTGALTGTDSAGVSSFTIKVCDINSDCSSLAVTLTVGGGSGGSSYSPALPQAWVQNTAGDIAITSPTYTVTFPSSGSGGNWSCGATNYGPYTASSSVSAQQVLNDAEACRTANGGTPNILIVMPATMVFSSANGLIKPQSSNTLSTGWITTISSNNAYLASNSITGSHGMQDNCSASVTDPRIDNYDLTGQNMSFACGPANTSGVITGITTLSVNTTTLSAITASSSAQLVNLVNGYVSPTLGGSSSSVITIDTGANQETVTPLSGVNNAGLYAVFTKNHASGVCVVYDTTGCGATVTNGTPPFDFTLANGVLTNTGAYNDLADLWVVETSGTNKTAMQTCSPLGASGVSIPPACASTTRAPDHWRDADMLARMSVGNTGSGSNIVSINVNGNETSPTQIASYIEIDRSAVLGDWKSLNVGANSVSTGILLGCDECSITNTQVSQVLRPGGEGHALGAAWGATLKIVHNNLVGQSSGFFCGGFTFAPTIPGLVPCTDVQLGRNNFVQPYTWLGQNDSTCGTKGSGTVPHGNPYWGCTTSTSYSLVRKNAWEIKEGQRIVVYGNIFDGSDNSGGQGGPLHDFNVRNSSATTYAGSNNYQAVISDITYQNNIARNGCEGFEVDSSGSSLGNGGGVSFIPTRFSFANDLFYGVSANNPGCTGAASVGMYLDSNFQQWKGTITENSAGTQATFVATCSIDGGNCPAAPTIGFQVFDINPGDAVSISGCTAVTAFNVPTKVVASYTVPAGIGPLAASGTNPASLTVSYPWTATANAVDNSGNCILTKGQGGPANVSMTHMTFVTDSTHAITSTNGPSAGPNYAINADLQNNIILGGGLFNNPLGVGTPTEIFNFDITSFTFDHTVWPTGTASKYTAYGNNPIYPVTSPVLYFPPTPYCTGASPTSSCVGFTGAMSASSMPLSLTDYHNFALMAGSVFKAGGADQASDGTDQGANISTIDAAQTLNQYVCPTSCGSPGPFPDN